MAQPPKYQRQNDFQDDLGTAHGTALDDDFDTARVSINAIIDNLAVIQRDDGALKNQSVHPDALNSATLALIASDWTPRGAWVTATVYSVGDVVEEDGTSYVCAVQHVAGTFSVDKAAGKWIILTGATLGQLALSSGSSLVGFIQDSIDAEARTVQSKLREIVSFEDFGAAGDGATDDTAAVQAAIDHLIANNGGILIGKPGSTYLVDQADFSGLDDAFLIFSGCTFRISNGIASSNPGLHFDTCNRLTIDVLRATNAGGYETGRSRLIRFDTCVDMKVGRIEVEYDAQHLPADSNTGSSLWQLADSDRACVIQFSSKCVVDYFKAVKADIALRIQDCQDVSFGYIDINSYMKGVKIEGGERVSINGGVVRGETPTYENHMRSTYADWRKDRPGNNGILVGDDDVVTYTNANGIILQNLLVRDPGEHGIRIAGDNGDRKRIRLSNITTMNTGGAGVKFLGSDTTYAYDTQIENITVIDCNVDETTTIDSNAGVTQFVYSSTGNTITVTGVKWPEDISGKTITITGSTSNNGSYTVSSRDSDTQITVGSALVNETDSDASSNIEFTSDNKVSHGLILYNVRRCTVNGVLIDNDNNTDSCEDGINLHDVSRVSISGVMIRNPSANGISFRPSNGGTSNDITGVHVSGAHIISAGGSGLYWNHEQITLSDLNFEGIHLVDCATGITIENSGSTPGTLAAGCRIQAHLDGCTTNYVSDQSTVLVQLSGDADSSKSTSAYNGSTWQVENDTTYELHNGAWVPENLSGTFTGTATGFSDATPPSGTFTWHRKGNQVTLNFPTISGTSNATTFTITGMPAALAPTSTQVMPCRVRDNGNWAFGLFKIVGGGSTITIDEDAGAGAFTNSGTKSLGQGTVTYLLS